MEAQDRKPFWSKTDSATLGSKQVLVVEDDHAVRENLREMLEEEGYEVLVADGGRAGIDLALRETPDLVVCDVRMPGLNGHDVLRAVRTHPSTKALPFIFLTAANERESIRAGMELGADDYITKPFSRVELLEAITARFERQAVLESALARTGQSGVIVADGGMSRLYEQAEKAGRSLLSTLILGETGVGKEVLARFVHDRSPRAKEPFVAINCAALNPNLIESELFGYERGSYTGAATAREGLIEAAAGGTVFLDEVGELPLSAQVKLLRVLEERRVMRIGGRAAQRVDVRFVAATNRDLETAAEEGSFRSDLLYRLNGFVLRIPPLRERRGEILPLAREFLRQSCERQGLRDLPQLSAGAVDALLEHSWPGNVRELKNAIERAVAMAERGRIERADLPTRIAEGMRCPERASQPEILSRPAPSARIVESAPDSERRSIRTEVLELEKRRIVEALTRCGGNQTAAAELLGMSRRTLVSRLSSFALPRPRKRGLDEAQRSSGATAISAVP